MIKNLDNILIKWNECMIPTNRNKKITHLNYIWTPPECPTAYKKKSRNTISSTQHKAPMGF